MMKAYTKFFVMLLVLSGCAGYKELEPEPPLNSVERGYVELKAKKNENFKLEQGDKYFMKFPPPPSDHFYLILVTSTKRVLVSNLSGTFDGGRESVTPILDLSPKSDNMSVYPIDTKSQFFYWVIDTVRFDTTLILNYRYVPEWRYTFENRYTEFQKILVDNVVDRTTYNSISPVYDLEKLDVLRELAIVEQKNGKLNSMKTELDHLESIFPKNIASSNDTAYARYVVFRKKVDEELAFQGNYTTALNLFKKERETRDDMGKFLEAIPYFTSVVSQSGKFPPPLMSKITSLLVGRLSDISPYMEKLLRDKNDATKFGAIPSLQEITDLYRELGQQVPQDLQGMFAFIQQYNAEVDAEATAEAKFEGVQTYFRDNLASATPSFYTDLSAKISDIKSATPDPELGGFVRYANYKCGRALTEAIMNTTNHTNDLGKIYEEAGPVSSSISSYSWSSAETHLRQLNSLRGVSSYPEVTEQRNVLVKKFETEIFSAIKTASEQRADGFISARTTTLDNISQLYSDSSFYPVYQITFSSAGPNDVARKRKQIDDYLSQAKFIRFPETAIKGIYEEFTRNSRERGVEKARAIVEHGKFYRGNDKQIKGLITECDVQAAKWILKPKEYRKLFALPITSNLNGENDYMFRIQLKIPSEGEFPVFDVNLKLPQEVSEKAGESQWYESITIDKKPIKNEGRFRITSPTVENNYEALITPVQMDKEGKNILEIRFKYSGFRVFEVSAMAQVPIIRKN